LEKFNNPYTKTNRFGEEYVTFDDPPGFAHDESEETLGEHLMLPAQYEQYREQLEQRLIPIQVRELD